MTWERFTVRGACLVVPAVLVALPYNLTIGGITTKPSATKMIEDIKTSSLGQEEAPPLTTTAQPLAVWSADYGLNSSSVRLGWSVQVMFQLLSRSLFWVLWVPTLIGLWEHRRRLAGLPAVWVMATACALLLAMLFWVTYRLGYLSERHLVLVLMCLVYPTGCRHRSAGPLLAEGLARSRPALAGTRWTVPAGWALTLLVLLTAVPAVKSLEPLHHNRSGFRDVGCWLAEYTAPEDPIFDPFGWAHYYAGRIFTEPLPGSTASLPPRYVVVEETGNNHPHLLGWAQAQKLIKEDQGQVIHTEPVHKGKIIVYQLCN